MELNSYNFIQNGEAVRKCLKDSPKIHDTCSSKAMRENAPVDTENERTDYENKEHISSLPTVFEGKITVEGKLSGREQLSNIVNLRKSGSTQDIRGEDPRPLSPVLSRFSSQESLDDSLLLRSTGVRMPYRKISSPLPAGKMTSPLCGRRRAQSESPAEALISPVIPRRCFSPKQLNKGVSRVMSCPVLRADSNEYTNKLIPSPPVSPRFNFEEISLGGAKTLGNRTKFITTPISAYPVLKTPEQDRLPRIHQTRCSSMLTSGAQKTPTESARELFNVSPVMGQSAVPKNRHSINNQCDVTDKVQYFLHSISVEEGIDQ